MKKSFLCTGLALACALGLSACGGDDDGQLQLGVQLFGVTKEGLKITNKGGTPIAVPVGSVYVFPDLIPVDSDYDIKVVEQPANTVPNSCEVMNGKGNTGSFSPNNLAIVCVVKTFTLGGTVSGLTGGNLIVNNGAHSVTIAENATTFTMTTPATTTRPKAGEVAEGVPYGLTVLQQPAGRICTIVNPNGLMPAGDVNNIVINCAPAAA